MDKGDKVMKRLIENDLLAWKNNSSKKPLMVFGARQVGKTYSILKFGKENYADMVCFNFENNAPLCSRSEERRVGKECYS